MSKNTTMKLKLQLAAAICAAVLVSAPVSAGDLSTASTNLSGASGEIVEGSLHVAATSGELIVASVTTVGDTLLIVLRGAGEASKVVIRLSATGAGAVSLAAGQSVTVLTQGSGQALIASGKVIAYLPNEAGKRLFHHSRHAERI
jgi:hypothetical protein